jgi:hypothetical protein
MALSLAEFGMPNLWGMRPFLGEGREVDEGGDIMIGAGVGIGIVIVVVAIALVAIVAMVLFSRRRTRL